MSKFGTFLHIQSHSLGIMTIPWISSILLFLTATANALESQPTATNNNEPLGWNPKPTPKASLQARKNALPPSVIGYLGENNICGRINGENIGCGGKATCAIFFHMTRYGGNAACCVKPNGKDCYKHDRCVDSANFEEYTSTAWKSDYDGSLDALLCTEQRAPLCMTYTLPVNNVDVEWYGCDSTTASALQVLSIETEKFAEIYIDGRTGTKAPFEAVATTYGAVITSVPSSAESTAEGSVTQATPSVTMKNMTGRRFGNTLFRVFLSAFAAAVMVLL